MQTLVLSKIDRILGILLDGRVNDLEDLRGRTELPSEQLLEITVLSISTHTNEQF